MVFLLAFGVRPKLSHVSRRHDVKHVSEKIKNRKNDANLIMQFKIYLTKDFDTNKER